MRKRRLSVLGLASVLWQLRRSRAIETGLLQIGEPDEERPAQHGAAPVTDSVISLMEAALSGRFDKTSNEAGRERATNGDRPPELDSAVDCAESGNAKLALRFLRLAKFDNGVFERLNRYETSLWRQVAQLLFALNFFHQLQRRHSAIRQGETIRSRSLVAVEDA
jgi:hypothetical protein